MGACAVRWCLTASRTLYAIVCDCVINKPPRECRTKVCAAIWPSVRPLINLRCTHVAPCLHLQPGQQCGKMRWRTCFMVSFAAGVLEQIREGCKLRAQQIINRSYHPVSSSYFECLPKLPRLIPAMQVQLLLTLVPEPGWADGWLKPAQWHVLAMRCQRQEGDGWRGLPPCQS